MFGKVPRDCFTRMYMSLPYELDANAFAYEKTKEICDDTAELQELYSYWTPNDEIDYNEHKKLFCLVDDMLRKNGCCYELTFRLEG